MSLRIAIRARSLRPYASLHRLNSTLLLVEHKDKELSPSILNAIQAAKQLKHQITALVCGHNCSKAAELARSLPFVSKVLYVDHPWFKDHSPEQYGTLIRDLCDKHHFSHLLSTSSSFGRGIIPRASALLSVQPVTDVVEILDDRTFKRPMYAGNALATLRYKDGAQLKALTIRASSFATPEAEGSALRRSDGDLAPLEQLPTDFLEGSSGPLTHCEGTETTRSDRPDLTQARVVVCGGRALKSRENFEVHISQLAEALGGAVGATRAAVDAGYVSNDLQIGQTGKVVAPDLYLGFGVSGAIQHLAGMKDSKVIVAVNNDADAPIFQIADYGLKEDVFKALPALLEEIRKLPKPSK